MAATVANIPSTPGRHPFDHDQNDVFTSDSNLESTAPSYQHRFSAKFDLDPIDLSSTSSPSQVKRTIEAHLQETDRRLLDTQKLGTSLLKQREDLTSRLEEVEQYQDEAQIPTDLRRRLADIEREHADVGREVARALIGPKAKQDDLQPNDHGVFTSQATGSPTKISAPSRRQRNQPSTRAGDLQFAADISTSLLAQVRQLQAAVAERDETIKRFDLERDSTDRDLQAYTHKIRALDESEQKYKDENWSLETQKHDLLAAARDAQDKEKRLNASLVTALAEKNKLHNDLEEINMTHSKLVEEHNATKKAHDTEIHGLKRNVDVADSDRQNLQDKIDELIAQNQELAKAIATRSRSRQANIEGESSDPQVETVESLDTPEDSPPPSPTKATPRHGALESETLRSSLHHAHRMIQNLKSNIHREKTEKIELKRMLQEARDDLEQRRGSDNGSAAKRQKTKSEVFKKPARPDMLGGTRRSRTDIEMNDEDWEDHQGESPAHSRPNAMLSASRGNIDRFTDQSDAYQTANETESNFDTADERNTTESEAFMTGAESLAGDSTDELTETEDTTSRTTRVAPGRVGRSSLISRPAGDRASYLSTASTSGDEADDTQTPVQPSFSKFKLRNNRSSFKPNVFVQQSTPDSLRSRTISQDSPATIMTEQSPAAGEQSLFAELGGMDEINSETQSLQSTPARSSVVSSQHSTPGVLYTPSKSASIQHQPVVKPAMVDSSTNTEAWAPEPVLTPAQVSARDLGAGKESMLAGAAYEQILLPSAFPLPPSVPTSPMRRADNSTQYTPQRGSTESPSRPTSSYITPPKMVWDEGHEGTPSNEHFEQLSRDEAAQSLAFSDVLSQESPPLESSEDSRAALLLDLEDSRSELQLLRANLDQEQAHIKLVEESHTKELNSLSTRISDYSQELENLRIALAASESEKLNNTTEIANLNAALAKYESRLALLSATAYSPILSQETRPVSTPAAEDSVVATGLGVIGSPIADGPKTPERPRTAERVADSRLISAATTLDSPQTQRVESPLAQHEITSEPVLVRSEMVDSATSPLREISAATEQSPAQRNRASSLSEFVKPTTNHDEGSQTMLTAQQIEDALRPRKGVVAPVPVPVRTRSPSARSPTRYPGRPSSRGREVMPIVEDTTVPIPTSPTRRPGSSSSNRASSIISQTYPPLPSDHKDIIAKANTQLDSPSRRESSNLRAGGIMGPPVMPASAMRRPRTPSESIRAATPSQGTVRKRGTLGSHVSRRSSVSSFASELDERFNIRPDHQADTHGFQAGPGTDPRMIQAITQTMIGEFLWKYTRKAGSKEMSSTRHRRYFWVHPYTKTLYWSEQDPQTAGRTENKAKSVAIESVRVVTDDNPMPPGLHRKSLEVTTPGRVVKFTASTGQRHETWFNALSYLLHRGDDHENGGTYITGDNDITQADIAEFSVNGYGARLVPNDSRMSMSSYNSRTTRGTTSNRVSHIGRQSVPIGTVSIQPGYGSAHVAGQQANQDSIRRSRQDVSQVADKDRTIRAGSVSRISRMLGSVTGRGKLDHVAGTPQTASQTRVNAGDVNSIYNASIVSDGRREEEEEARRQRERENNPGLEDVRACCDGKHNVASLPHRQVSNSTTQNRISNAINRSMSRRT